MSDLQCPARIFLAPSHRDQTARLARSLRAARVARVWCGPLPQDLETAEIVAGLLGVDVVVCEDLGERDTDVGERVDDTGQRVAGVLDEVADEHRGEAVLVVSRAEAIRAALPLLVSLPGTAAGPVEVPGGEYVALERDGDGWSLGPAGPE